MKKMSSGELKQLDDELTRFRFIDKEIRNRKSELESNSSDDIILGIRTNKVSKPTENIVMKYATDVTLKNLETFKETVSCLIKKLTEEQFEIFYLRWGQPGLDWEEIAEKKFFSSSTIYRKRRHILETYALIKGIL